MAVPVAAVRVFILRKPGVGARHTARPQRQE